MGWKIRMPAQYQSERWNVADVIDFELALDVVDSTGAADDRAVFVTQIAPMLGDQAGVRSKVFLAWLHARNVQRASSAGIQFERGVQALLFSALFTGLVMGAGTTASLLTHEGAQPINVALFLAGTVGLQLGVIALVLLGIGARAAGFDFTPVMSWIKALANLMTGVFNRLSGERRMEARLLRAKISARSDRLGPFVSLQLLQVTQAFAIAFNLGILGAMLLIYLPFVELRFGWQSTYSFGPEAVFTAVQAIAAPWSWISDSLAPTMHQVFATQFARGQGSLSLDASSAHAWWPFLLCAVAFYGLIPRLVAVAVMQGLLRIRLRGLKFEYPAANALWRRLHGPLVVSDGGEKTLPVGVLATKPDRGRVHQALAIKSDACDLNDEQVSASIQQSLGWTVTRTIPACIDDDQLGPSLLAELQTRPEAVVVVAPATQNPIVAIAGFLREVSAALEPGGEVIVLLTGESGPAMDSRLQVWSRFAVIHRLNVGVEPCR